MNLIQRTEWYLYKKAKKLRLKNRDFSIISSNCNGSFVYHDMGLRFLTPTVNLSFEMNDFVEFLTDIHYYLSLDLVECEDDRYNFPTGMLGDIELRFNHFKTFDSAKQKWDERKQRINWNNLFIMAIDGDGCTYESMLRFDKLPYRKVIFTHKPYPEIESSYYIKGYEDDIGVGVLIDFKKQFWIRRQLDDFDYISFLNSKSK